MPKYEVIIQIEGTETFEVEADSEKEAVEKALQGEAPQTNTETMNVNNGNHEASLIE